MITITIITFVNDLRHAMVMKRPLVESLESQLDKDLKMIKSKNEKLELLNEVLKLKNAQGLDIYYMEGIQSFFIYVKHKIMTLTPESDKTRKELSFKDLFIKEETADLVDKIFEENGYTKDGIWIDSGLKKRIATAFYVLKDQYTEINAIRPGKDISQLRVFCNHYGIKAEYKGGDVTFKNLLNRPDYEITEKTDYIEFEQLFKRLK